MSKKKFLVKTLVMKKQEYIEKAKKSILNRVVFHSPIVFERKIDNEILKANNIDIRYPVFKFDKQLDKRLLRAFELAQAEHDFNLVLKSSSLNKIKSKKLKHLKRYFIYDVEECPKAFVEMINKLNINYQASSNYNVEFKDKFIKLQDLILNPSYQQYLLRQTEVYDNLWFDYQEFVLNGNNYFLRLKNVSNETKKVGLEINIPLKKGYYYFKKLNRAISIENLLSKEKLYFNFVCKNAKFSFSEVDGLENSVFSCINLRLSFSMQPKEERFVFFNMGDSKFVCQTLREIKKLKDLSIKKCCEIFDIQVKTKNQEFDKVFNLTLPKKIWINWLNNKVDLSLEEKYVNLKRLFVRGQEKRSFVPFKQIGLKEIGVFNGEYYKKILVVNSAQKYFKVGKTHFFNFNDITNFSLKSKEPLELSFGD